MKFHMIAGGPKPVAPFSHAVETDGFVFVTGQMPDTPDSPGKLPATIEEQTRAVMANLRLVLAGLDLDFEQVVMARIYLTRFQAGLRSSERNISQLLCRRSATRSHLRRRHGPAYDAMIEIDLICRRSPPK